MSLDQLYKLFLNARCVSTDSRKIEKDCLYFALKGERFDGNEFAEQAIDKGALAAIVDDFSLNANPNLIFVDDVLETLQSLARLHRVNFRQPVFAITGSNGKTTTKELIAASLSQQFKIHVTEGNLNNHIGVPLTLLAMPLDADIAIIEMGANHIGEIKFLCEIADPDFGMITNVGNAHLEGFGSFEGVKIAKSELYRYLVAKGGKIFLNRSEGELEGLIPHGAEVFSYGSDSNVNYQIDLIETHPQIKYSFSIDDKQYTASSILSGIHNFQNIKSAVAVSLFFGVEPEKIRTGIEAYVPKNNRSQKIVTENNKVFLDAYNANPASVIASLEAFMANDPHLPIIILGDMLELGPYSVDEHQKIHDYAGSLNLGSLFLVGEEYGKIRNEKGLHFQNVELLIEFLEISPIVKKEIFLKASRGIRLEKVVKTL